jgi:hypothetical protein
LGRTLAYRIICSSKRMKLQRPDVNTHAPAVALACAAPALTIATNGV